MKEIIGTLEPEAGLDYAIRMTGSLRKLLPPNTPS